MVASSSNEYGRLAFVGSDMIAVLVRQEGQNHAAPRWSIDWMAPEIDGRPPPQFTQVEAARAWLSHRYRTSRSRNKAGSR
jgi:hypothetical protein